MLRLHDMAVAMHLALFVFTTTKLSYSLIEQNFLRSLDLAFIVPFSTLPQVSSCVGRLFRVEEGV